MDYLHSKDIAHRDLKSDNVLVSRFQFVALMISQVFSDNRLAISDFGFAKVKQIVSSKMTMGVGTLRWMAPGKLMKN